MTTADEKWELVKAHYGTSPFRSRKTGEVVRPSDRMIETLYQEMIKFVQNTNELMERRDLNVEKFLSWQFKKRSRFGD